MMLFRHSSRDDSLVIYSRSIKSPKGKHIMKTRIATKEEEEIYIKQKKSGEE